MNGFFWIENSSFNVYIKGFRFLSGWINHESLLGVLRQADKLSIIHDGVKSGFGCDIFRVIKNAPTGMINEMISNEYFANVT